jgi:hypothetical protein
MRRGWAVAAVVALVASISGVAGYLVGRHAEAPTPPADATRLHVAAWIQDWPAIDPSAAHELHVASTGTGDDCTTVEPCALVTARALVRAQAPTMTTDLIVSLASGDYLLDEPFVLGTEDSGHNGHVVRYRAEPAASPILNRGRGVTGWRAPPGQQGVFVAPVPDGTDTRQLFVDGRRATRAKGPLHPPGWSRQPTGFTAPDDQMAAWRHPEDLEIVSFAEWRAFRCGVASVSERTVTMDAPCWRNASAPSRFAMEEVTWVENAVELLDEPGEWYLDAHEHLLYYWPREGEDLATSRVTIATGETVLRLAGTAEGPVHDVGFEGLTFAYAGWLGPSGSDGYASTQAGWHRAGDAGPDPLDIERTPGAVQVMFAHHVHVERNTFTHLGAVGLDVGEGTQDIGVIGNRFRDVSSTGIQVGEGRQGAQNAAPSHQIDRLQIADNLIDTVAVEYVDAVGIFVSYASNASLLHNELTHLPYTGISLGWGWGTDSYARNNLVSANRISDVMTTLQDGGAIYTLSPMPGTVIERNHIVDQRHRSGAIFLDEGTAFVTVAENVVERSSRWLHIWTSTIHDNVVVDNAADGADQLDDGVRNRLANNATTQAAWPAGAQQVIDEAGLDPAFADLRS